MEHPEVLYEDNHLIIINKPNGLLSHSDKTGDHSAETLVESYIVEKYNKPGRGYAKLVHRIDRPVSGVLILARTSKAHERMAKLFKDRQVEKTYWALTTRMPRPESGEIRHYLRKDRRKNVVSWNDNPREGYKEAVTSYTVLASRGAYHLVELRPETGRSHQLRVALRSKRCPIVGDVKYNGTNINNPKAIMLHSRQIEFVHPVRKERMVVVAPLPRLPHWDGFYDMV